MMIGPVTKQNCVGCGACVCVCPLDCVSMQPDSEGFWYPAPDADKCNSCGLCQRVCPVFSATGVSRHPIAYAGICLDDCLRSKSSSGGIFTLLANTVLADGGVVFGAAFDSSLSVAHMRVETMQEVERLRGSKYVQSWTGNIYEEVGSLLSQGREVLFSGTPCQIAGLRAYLGTDCPHLFCVDIICHGVPSPKVWQKYIAYQERCLGAPIHMVRFRDKERGWKRFSLSLQALNGKCYSRPLDSDPYMQMFLKNVSLRPSCYSCSFRTLDRLSDITLADFWGVWRVLPEMDDDKGVSLVLVNSMRGRDFFDRVKDCIMATEVHLDKAIRFNTSAIKNPAPNRRRQDFFDDLDTLTFEELTHKYCSDGFVAEVVKPVRRLPSLVLGYLRRMLHLWSD